MPLPPDRRARKRLALRESISDVATRLFAERGFDHVTVDEIAVAADVGRKTVFNHFARKEDLFFDRDDEIRETLRAVVRQRAPGVAPLEAYALFARRLVAQRSHYVELSSWSQRFVETIEGSETLKARARALRDELAHVVAEALAECVGRDPADADAHLAAHLLLATWTAARIHAHRVFVQSHDTEDAMSAFLLMMDKGIVGLKAALAGTPYS